MNRRGNSRHFSGVPMQLTGDDGKPNDALDELEFMSGVIVDARRDSENGNGTLSLHGSAEARARIAELAKEHGLKAVM